MWVVSSGALHSTHGAKVIARERSSKVWLVRAERVGVEAVTAAATATAR